MSQGIVMADLKLSNLPKLDTGFRILLNRGMNMKFFRDSIGVLRYNDSPGDDVLKYRIHNGKNYIPLPENLKISYSGAFPVYQDTLSFFDYKGVIAFNGKTLRASEQSKWYPVIYDVKADRELTALAYDITIDCQDCKTIYLNGSVPQTGPLARFKSERPFELLLFTGDYQQQAFAGSDFLNADIPSEVARQFDLQISGLKKFYAGKLGIPYPQKITFIQHKAIEPFGPNRSWGFVTFPSIAVAGGQFKGEIVKETGKFNHILKYSFYAHELGHYYFGHLLSPNSTMWLFLLESPAEYLSVKAAAAEYGEDSTRAYIKNKQKLLMGKKIIPLSKVTRAEQVDDAYRYSYGPLVLLAFEQLFGEKRTYKFLATMIKHANERTDYSFLVKMARESGLSEKEWASFELEVLGLEDAEILPAKLLRAKS